MSVCVLSPIQESRFLRVWAVYPRGEDRGGAERAWRTLDPSDELTAEIVADVEYRKQQFQWTKEGGRFVPYLARYLEEARWRDGKRMPKRPKSAETERIDRGKEELRRFREEHRERERGAIEAAFTAPDDDDGSPF